MQCIYISSHDCMTDGMWVSSLSQIGTRLLCSIVKPLLILISMSSWKLICAYHVFLLYTFEEHALVVQVWAASGRAGSMLTLNSHDEYYLNKEDWSFSNSTPQSQPIVVTVRAGRGLFEGLLRDGMQWNPNLIKWLQCITTTNKKDSNKKDSNKSKRLEDRYWNWLSKTFIDQSNIVLAFPARQIEKGMLSRWVVSCYKEEVLFTIADIGCMIENIWQVKWL